MYSSVYGLYYTDRLAYRQVYKNKLIYLYFANILQSRYTRLEGQMTIAFGKAGWEGYLCDSGSKHNGQRVLLKYDGDVESNRCVVYFKDGKVENTFMRLLKEVYNKENLTYFKKGDVVLIFETGAIDHGVMGVLTDDARVDEFTNVKLMNNKSFLGKPKNFIKC